MPNFSLFFIVTCRGFIWDFEERKEKKHLELAWKQPSFLLPTKKSSFLISNCESSSVMLLWKRVPFFCEWNFCCFNCLLFSEVSLCGCLCVKRCLLRSFKSNLKKHKQTRSVNYVYMLDHLWKIGLIIVWSLKREMNRQHGLAQLFSCMKNSLKRVYFSLERVRNSFVSQASVSKYSYYHPYY